MDTHARETSVDAIVNKREPGIKWTRQVKQSIQKLQHSDIHENAFRRVEYRPCSREFLYFDDFWNEERYLIPEFLPTETGSDDNLLIVLSGVGSQKPFQCLALSIILTLDLLEKTQCFPFYSYPEDGTNRRENITHWALEQFRSRYGDPSIIKWDFFHYVYAVLHHPEYRQRYAANPRRELPHSVCWNVRG